MSEASTPIIGIPSALKVKLFKWKLSHLVAQDAAAGSCLLTRLLGLYLLISLYYDADTNYLRDIMHKRSGLENEVGFPKIIMSVAFLTLQNMSLASTVSSNTVQNPL